MFSFFLSVNKFSSLKFIYLNNRLNFDIVKITFYKCYTQM